MIKKIAKSKIAKPKILLHQWLNDNIDPWAVYNLKTMKKVIKEKTGYELKAVGITAEELNKTVGQFKGLLAELPNPEEVMIEGWLMIETLWHQYGQYINADLIERLNGRGSIADACIEALKQANI